MVARKVAWRIAGESAGFANTEQVQPSHQDTHRSARERMVYRHSLCEGAAVISLGAADIGDEVLGRVQVECGREDANDGEKQEKDRTRKQPTDNQTHFMDGMKME